MAGVTVIRQSTFAGGEVAPTLHERTDLKGFLNSLKTCRGFIITKHGVAMNRPGTKFVAEVKDSTKTVRLVAFRFGSDQNFVLEFGDLYIRFYQNGGAVLSGGVPYEVVTPYAYADLPRLKFQQAGDTITIVHPSYALRELKRLGNTNWTLGASWQAAPVPMKLQIYLRTWGAATGKTWQYGLTAVYADGRESLPRITSQFDPSADLEITWEVGAVGGQALPASYRVYKGQNGVLGQIYEVFASDLTLKSGVGPVVGDQITLHDTGQFLIDYNRPPPVGYSPFHDAPAAWAQNTHYHAGDQVTANGNVYEAANAGMSAASGTGPAAIGAVSDGAPLRKASTAYVLNDLITMLGTRFKCTVGGTTGADGRLVLVGGGGAETSWQIMAGAQTDGTAQWTAVGITGGSATEIEDLIQWKYVGSAPGAARYPAASTYFEQRQWFANLTDSPSDLVASQVGAFKNFDVPGTVLADSSISGLILNALKYEEIRWLLPTRVLLVGTSEAIWPVTGAGGSNDAITALSRKTHPEVFRGVSWLDPVMVGQVAVVVADLDSAVYELSYDFRYDSYLGTEISVAANHLFDGATVKDMAYMPLPHSVVWQVRSDGTLIGLTRFPEQDVTAWHWHDTQGTFENVCVVREGSEYGLYVVVRRKKGDGTYHRYVERFASRVLPRLPDHTVDTRLGVFLDCSLSYSGAPVTQLSGLDHLEGLAVTVLADGEVEGPYPVQGGAIDISDKFPDGASIINAGLPYLSQIESLDFAVQGVETGMKLKRVVRVGLRMIDTRGGEVGPSLDKLVRWVQREVKDSYNAVPAFSGAKRILVPSGFDLHGRVAVQQADPLPMTVVGISREVELGD